MKNILLFGKQFGLKQTEILHLLARGCKITTVLDLTNRSRSATLKGDKILLQRMKTREVDRLMHKGVIKPVIHKLDSEFMVVKYEPTDFWIKIFRLWNYTW